MSEITQEQLDSIYAERNKCVALLIRMALALGLYAGISLSGSEEDGWSHHACIALPSGQVTWHIHDSEMENFNGIPSFHERWDGHDTETKYQRVLNPHLELAPVAMLAESIRMIARGRL